MTLTAIFWGRDLRAGHYPPLAVGDEVRIAFQLQTGISLRLAEIGEGVQDRHDHLGLAEYSFQGRLLRLYEQSGIGPLGAKEAVWFDFYIEHGNVPKLRRGAKYAGRGTLLVDYCIWTESLSEYESPPDLFFNLCVARIRHVAIPERLVRRSDRDAMSWPARVARRELHDRGISEVSATINRKQGREFYVLNIDSGGLEDGLFPLTFGTQEFDTAATRGQDHVGFQLPGVFGQTSHDHPSAARGSSTWNDLTLAMWRHQTFGNAELSLQAQPNMSRQLTLRDVASGSEGSSLVSYFSAIERKSDVQLRSSLNRSTPSHFLR